MDEKQVITAVLDGNQERYSELVNRYHVGLIIHCERLLNDRDSAEDIAQEAFIAAFDNLHSFDNAKRFSTWLYRIATNKALDELRRQKRFVHDVDFDEIAAVTDTLDEVKKKEVREAVLALVPPEYRRVVEAYYWEGKSYEAIAQELDKPINTIRTWLRRAKVTLKGVLL